MDHQRRTAAIILAAGTSSRMGEAGNKLLLPLQQRPVLAHVLQAVYSSQARPIILVLGHQAEGVRAQLRPELEQHAVEVVVNADYAQGQSTSMQAGLRALLSTHADAGLTSVMFLLGDQPLMTSALIDRLITLRERTGQLIALPLYNGQRGNPVVFSLELAPHLLQISGDEGGRSLIRRYAQASVTLEVDEEEINLDVDTWAAYLQAQAAWQRKMVRPLPRGGKSWQDGEIHGMDRETQRTHTPQAHFWLTYSHELSAAIRYQEALAAIERALALERESADIWYAQGTYLAMLARHAEALASFEQALALDASFVPAWDGKAWALSILGHRQEALVAVNRALELNPEYFAAVQRKKRLEAI